MQSGATAKVFPYEELAELVAKLPLPVIRVKADGTMVWANSAGLQLLGCEEQEYSGRNIAAFFADSQCGKDMLQRLREGAEFPGCVVELRAKDGSIRAVSLTASGSGPVDRFLVMTCITENGADRQGMTEIQERLAAIVESSDDAIISKDLNGIIRSWNRGAERIFGYTADEIVGKPVATLAAPDRVDEVPGILARIRRGERVDHYETKRRTKDGRILSISLTVSPVRDANGKVVGASKIARDITDRVRAEAALRQANEALRRANDDMEQFAYSASHDLQEPLRMVSTYAEIVRRKFGGLLGTDGEQYLRYLVDGAQRMQQLVRDLLAYTKVSDRGDAADFETDANEALSQALSNLQLSIANSGARIESDALPRVPLPKVQLQQVFQNLIANAIRYRREEPPEICISARRLDSEWLFSVSDNGIGIEPQYRERIFGIFKRLRHDSEIPGTGIGLAICRRAIHSAGGRIWVESEPGNGSTFHFTVPVAAPSLSGR